MVRYSLRVKRLEKIEGDGEITVVGEEGDREKADDGGRDHDADEQRECVFSRYAILQSGNSRSTIGGREETWK